MGIKIALVNYEKEGGYLPITTAYLAAYARSKGYEDIKIIDQKQNKKEILKEILKYKPDIVGFGVFCYSYHGINEIVGKIKKILDIPIIAGGAHIYGFPEQIKNSNFDVGVTGEGEIPFIELLKLLEKKKKFEPKDLRKIKGIAFRDEKGKLEMTEKTEIIKNIDDVPFPAFDLLDMKNHYTVPGPAGAKFIGRRAYILTSRGCPYNCIYCGSKCIWKTVRWHSAERTVEDIKIWVRKYGANHMYVYDDLIIANIPRLKKMVELLKKEKLLGKIDFEILGRANLITEECVNVLKELNCTTMAIGFESGSDKILKYLKGENVSVEQGKKAIELLYKNKIKICGLFMLGSPGETEEDLKKTYEFAKDPRIESVNVNITVPYSGTGLWNYAVENKIYPKNFFESGISFGDSILNLDYLLTREIPKERFEFWWKKFIKLVREKEKNYSPKFEIADIRFFFSVGLIKKILRRRNWIGFYLKHFLNFLGGK